MSNNELFEVSITCDPCLETALTDFLESFSPECLSVESGPEFPYCIKVFFEKTNDVFYTDLQSFVESLQKPDFSPDRWNVTTSKIKSQDWENAWKQYYQPLEIGTGILILPAWLDEPSPNERLTIRLNPGMAFGTGQHPSTHLCLEMAETALHEGLRVLDVGTGSGVLAIFAALRNPDFVLGLDIDPYSLPVAHENAELNQVAGKISLLAGEPACLVNGSFDFIFLNLTTEIIMKVGQSAISQLVEKGVCVFSGIIADDEAKIRQYLGEIGINIIETREKDGWLGIMGVKNAALLS